MAKKKDKESKVGEFTQKPYYYDRETTDSELQKEFGQLMSNLKSLNKNLQKELAKPGKAADLEIKKKD